ncbi:sulfotransferase family protein [Rubritalea spongiae]|uniref:Sulfotransferase family protein n=1 Tax=Rubritalea spongiae TaxID=430797 RepID=A0ABW5E0X5_9BACT
MNKYKLWYYYDLILPDVVKHKIRLSRHGSHFPQAYKDTNSVYIHIPKTAGTSIASAIYKDKGVGHGHYPYYEFLREDEGLYNSSFKFAFVRDPWDRLVSAYYHLSSPPSWVADRTKLVSEYINARADDFSEFVRLLSVDKRMQRWVHMEPQSKFVLHEGEVMVDFIGRFENLEEDVIKVAKALNLNDVKVPHVNKSKDRAHYSIFYDQYAIDFVRDFYAQDIDVFEYDYIDQKGCE